MSVSVFAFGGFRLDASRRLLFSTGGVVVPLTSRAFDTLVCFVQHPNELLEKATLLSTVWPNTVVEDNNLNQCIGVLRRALGETPGEHRFIVTVPGRGYRFVAPVRIETVEDEEPVEATPEPIDTLELPKVAEPGSPAFAPVVAPAWRVRALVVAGLLLLAAVVGLTAGRSASHESRSVFAVGQPRAPSVAVLPFADLSPSQDQEAFADGLSEELLSQLDRQSGLSVISRSSSFAFKGRNEDLRRVAKQLGADYLLEGSVRRAGDRMRVTLHLVEAVRGTRIWSDTVERTLKKDDVLTAQDEIAHAVVPSVAQRIVPRPQGIAAAQ